MKKLILLVILFLCASQPMGYGQDKVTMVMQGFLTGDDFLSMSDEQRQLYTIGLYNGITLSPFFIENSDQYIDWFVKLAKSGIRVSEVREIIHNYIKKNPEKSGQLLNILSWEALLHAFGYK